MKRLRTNFILNVISQVLRIITPFITTPYISRVLGVDNIGIFSLSYSFQSYFCLLAVLGTASYGAREIARNREKRDVISVSFWEIQLLRTVTTMLALAGWAVLVLLEHDNRIIFIILTTYVLAALFDITWFYTGLEQFPLIVARSVAVRLLEVAAIFIYVRKSGDLPIYCLIMGGGMLLGNMAIWINLNRYVDRVPFRELKPFRHLKETLVYFLPSIATTIYTVLDKTLIGVITKSTYENGIYEQATKVIEIAKAVTFTSLNTVLSPRSSYLFVTEQYELIKSNLKLSLDIMLTIGFGFCFGIAAVSERFVPIFFGGGYSGVILLLKLLSPIIVIITISNALGTQYYNPAGLRLKSAKFLIVGALCNLVMNVILIPFFKSAGAVIASVIAETVISALYLINCSGYLNLRQIIVISYKKIIAGLVMTAAIILLYRVIPDTVMGLLTVIFCGGAIFLAVLAVLGDGAISYAGRELQKAMKKILSQNK